MSQDNDETGLNGIRIPLIIDGVMFVTAVIGGTIMWSDIQYLKQQYASSVSAERIAKIEGQIELVDDRLTRNIADMKGVDESSRKDREGLHDRIERLEREMRTR